MLFGNESERLNHLLFESLLEQLQEIDQRLTDIETGTRSSGKLKSGPPHVAQMRSDIDEIARTLNLVNQRAANMRLDRQFVIGIQRLIGIDPSKRQREQEKLQRLERQRLEKQRDLKRALEAKRNRELMTVTADVLVICPAYPGGERAYGGEFVQKRVDAYKSAGLNPCVVEVSVARKQLARDVVNGIDVVRINPAGLGKVLSLSTFELLIAHSVEKPVWSTMKHSVGELPIVVCVHGFEARDWRELSFNFSQDELANLRDRLNKANDDRRETMAEIFESDGVDVLFVSNFMKDVAERFAGRSAKSGHVIHNPISISDFPYVEKSAEHRKKVLWVRSFAAKNYSFDISADVILGLSKRPYFEDLTFSIYGDGRFFEEATEPLRDFPNVHIERRFLSVTELRAAHADHGLMLVPTRWDSQGLTSGEAMSSGLIPLTSSVAAIPEFADETCAILAPFEDSAQLINGVETLYNDPDLFLEMSRAAAQRAQLQCGLEATTDQEIALLRSRLEVND